IRSNIKRAAEASEVDGRAVRFPEHGVRAGGVRWNGRVRARARGADRLAEIIDRESVAYRVPLERRKHADLAVLLPAHGLEVEFLKGRAALGAVRRVGRIADDAIFGEAHYLPKIVQAERVGVRRRAVYQGGKRLQRAIFPNSSETLVVSAVQAKVFARGTEIDRGLGADRCLTEYVRPVRRAVRSSQCAEIHQAATAKPEKSMLRSVGGQIRRSGHPAQIVQL